MSKAERLIEMMITINAKKDFTVGELANEFSVSKRTILRDLRELEQAGFPLAVSPDVKPMDEGIFSEHWGGLKGSIDKNHSGRGQHDSK